MDIQVYDSMKYLIAESTSDIGAVYIAETAPFSVRQHLINKSYVMDIIYDSDEHDQWLLFYDWSEDWYMMDRVADRSIFVAEWKNK